MLELGAPVVGPHAARYQPSRGRQFQSMCNASDGTAGDSAPRLSFEQAQAQLAGWCTVSPPLILGFDLANETEYNRWWPLLSRLIGLGQLPKCRKLNNTSLKNNWRQHHL